MHERHFHSFNAVQMIVVFIFHFIGSNHEFLTEQAFFLHPFRSAGGRVRAHSSNSVQWQSDSNAEPQPQAPAFVSPLANSRDYRMAHTRRAFPFIGDEEDDYEVIKLRLLNY